MVRTLQTGATHPIAMPYQGQANDYASPRMAAG